jgi:hypothetical protein
MENRTSYREALGIGPRQKAVFAFEFLSQPDISITSNGGNITRKTEKALPLAGEKDVLLVNQNVDRDYHKWLRSIDFGTDNIYEFNAPLGTPLTKLILDNSKSLKNYLDNIIGEKILIPNYSGNGEVRAAESVGLELYGHSEEITKKFYDKGSFKRIAKELGILVPEGTEYLPGDDLESLIRNNLKHTGKVLIKDPHASFGRGIHSIDESGIKDLVEQLPSNGKYVVEAEYVLDHEVNDQLLIDLDKKIHHIGTSYYKVDGRKSNGNEFPLISSEELSRIQETSRKIAEIKRDLGYRGPFGIDYGVTPDGQALALEDNARVNGSLIAFAIYDKIGERMPENAYFRNEFIKLKNPQRFSDFKNLSSDLLYDGKNRQVCLFPYDVTTICEDGNFRGVFAGRDKPEVDRFYNEFKSHFES